MADDFSADVFTTGSIVVGGSATGTIEPGSAVDRDWFAVEFVAGKTYLIELNGQHPVEKGLYDTFIRGVHSASGELIPDSTDDDSGPGFNSRLLFEATQTGRHFISAGSFIEPLGDVDWSGNGTGYTLSVTEVVILTGGPGDDVLIWQTGTIEASGGSGGRDTLSLQGAPVGAEVVLGGSDPGVRLGDAWIDLRDIENASGTPFDDRISGTPESNVLRGGAGRDVLLGDGGADILDGGRGRDTAVLADPDYDVTPGVVASLISGRVSAGEAAGTRLFGIENLTGGHGDDFLRGNWSGNVLEGDVGDDTLCGCPGRDTLVGGGGDDFLYGGTGTDVVIFGFAQSEYTITRDGYRAVVEHSGGDGTDGTDLVVRVEILRFADGDVFLFG